MQLNLLPLMQMLLMHCNPYIVVSAQHGGPSASSQSSLHVSQVVQEFAERLYELDSKLADTVDFAETEKVRSMQTEAVQDSLLQFKADTVATLDQVSATLHRLLAQPDIPLQQQLLFRSQTSHRPLLLRSRSTPCLSNDMLQSCLQQQQQSWTTSEVLSPRNAATVPDSTLHQQQQQPSRPVCSSPTEASTGLHGRLHQSQQQQVVLLGVKSGHGTKQHQQQNMRVLRDQSNQQQRQLIPLGVQASQDRQQGQQQEVLVLRDQSNQQQLAPLQKPGRYCLHVPSGNSLRPQGAGVRPLDGDASPFEASPSPCEQASVPGSNSEADLPLPVSSSPIAHQLVAD